MRRAIAPSLPERKSPNGSVAQYTHMDLDLRQVLDGSQTTDVPFKPGDELLVQQASNWHEPWHVVLEGQVNRPGPYPIREGERLAAVLKACGGFRPDAYPRAAVFIRKSVQKDAAGTTRVGAQPPPT